MIYDLTETVNIAIERAELWSIDRFFQTTKLLQKVIPKTVLDWEFENLNYWSEFTKIKVDWIQTNFDERTWVAVKKNREIIAYLRLDLPLLIIISDYLHKIQSHKYFEDIQVLSIVNFKQKACTISRNAVENLYRIKNIPSDFYTPLISDFNLECFSIQEFWWLTIIPPSPKKAQHDLTEFFISSSIRNKLEFNEFLIISEKITEIIPQSCLSYDQGEEWATINLFEDCLCILGVSIPIIFILNKYINSIQNHVDFKKIAILPVSSFESQEYKIDISLIEKTFPQWKLKSLPSVFSIFDFIFTTI